jgi:hypothetical protein
VITRNDREVTHFFGSDELMEQDSVARMFASTRGSRRRRAWTRRRTAFIAGYLTHLVLDETFIDEIYRPHFGALGATTRSQTCSTGRCSTSSTAATARTIRRR